MPQASLITDYLTVLSAQLPAPVVEELADGLDQTQQHYVKQGLNPDAAAGAALAEFGEPQVSRRRFHPAEPRPARCAQAAGRRTGGRRMLGGSTDHQPGLDLASPAAGRLLFGVALITVIGLLAAAAFGRRYLSARRAGAVACAGITVLDGVMLITVVLAIPVLIWPVILASAASAARLTFTARALRAVLTG